MGKPNTTAQPDAAPVIEVALDTEAVVTDSVTTAEPVTSESPAARQRFRVMRAVQLTAGELTMPGAIVEEGADWPQRRAKQFVDQGYLAPIVTGEG